jgi:D-amino peptidase
MRVFISVDMEGVAGVATLDQIVRGGSGYPRAQELMTEEASAAIRGAFAGGADEVVVNDSHGTMDNFLLDRLDARARVVTGAPRLSCMAQGVRRGDALAVFVGYHAPAGDHGTLAHTFSSNFSSLRVNGIAVSEAEVNALLCADAGVPVGVVTGDDVICDIVRRVFPGALAVETKQAHGYSGIDTLHPANACTAIEEAVSRATAGAGGLSALPLPDGFQLEADFVTPLHADFAALVPGAKRASGLTVAAEAVTVDEVMRTIMAWYYLSAHAATQFAAIALRK